eukprot:Nk52_evm10s147 gene=Nk52_evmTU10s147
MLARKGKSKTKGFMLYRPVQFVCVVVCFILLSVVNTHTHAQENQGGGGEGGEEPFVADSGGACRNRVPASKFNLNVFTPKFNVNREVTIQFTWPYDEQGGILTLLRNNSPIKEVRSDHVDSVVDEGLETGTEFSYFLVASVYLPYNPEVSNDNEIAIQEGNIEGAQGPQDYNIRFECSEVVSITLDPDSTDGIFKQPRLNVLNATAIKVEWEPPQSAEGQPLNVDWYSVGWSLQNNTDVVIYSPKLSPDTLTYTLNGLEDNTRYLVVVSAQIDESKRMTSEQAAARTYPYPPPTPSIVDMVVNSDADGHSEVLLKWTDSNATAYRVNQYLYNNVTECVAYNNLTWEPLWVIPDPCEENVDITLSVVNATEARVTALAYSTRYVFSIQSANQGGFSMASNSSSIAATAAEPDDGGDGFNLLWLIVIGLGVVLIVLLVVFFWHRSKQKKRDADVEMEGAQKASEPDLTPLPLPPQSTEELAPIREAEVEAALGTTHRIIPIGKLTSVVKNLNANGGEGFDEEYQSLAVDQFQNTTRFGALALNRPKNRYFNILPYDHTRVKLKPLPGEECSDYINASYVDGFRSSKAYIATQAPLEHTVRDFWRMVFQVKAPIVVMVANEEERGRIKCHRYWPSGTGESETHDFITVTNVQMEKFPTYIIRNLEMENNATGEKWKTIHLHFTGWPDHGVPKSTLSLLHFIRHCRSLMPDGKGVGPVVTHCSAGVGRTGTFICIDSNLQKMVQEGNCDIYGCTYEMREQRPYMIQTEDQYKFVYRALLDFLYNNNTEVSILDLPAYVGKLQAIVDAGNATLLDREFLLLDKGNLKPSVFEFSGSPENESKNRYAQFLPYDDNRVHLDTFPEGENDYINASYIDGFYGETAYIATQGPLANTLNDFWCMVFEKHVRTIVMITNLEEKGNKMCARYWPLKLNSTLKLHLSGESGEGIYDNRDDVKNRRTLCIRMVAEEVEQDDVCRTLEVSVEGSSEPRVTIRQFQYTSWLAGSPPQATSSPFLQFLSRVRQWHAVQEESGPMVVHCDNGVGRTGVFIAMDFSLDRLERDGAIDIYKCVCNLRKQRAFMVQNEQEYAVCYRAVLEFSQIYSSLYAEVLDEVKKRTLTRNKKRASRKLSELSQSSTATDGSDMDVPTKEVNPVYDGKEVEND